MFEKADILKLAPKHFEIFKEEVQGRVLDRLLKRANGENGFYSLLQLFKTLDNMNVETTLEDEWLPRPEDIQDFAEIRRGYVGIDKAIEFDDSKAMVLLQTWFNVDKRFGTKVETVENDDYINLYLTYDLATRKAKFQVIHYGANNQYAIKFDLMPNEEAWLMQEFGKMVQNSNVVPRCSMIVGII